MSVQPCVTLLDLRALLSRTALALDGFHSVLQVSAL
jgi:hypothetical protein